MKLKRLTACLLAGAMAASMVLTGCGSKINADAVGATMDGKEISLGYMNYVARYQQARTDISYMAYLGKEMWDVEVSEGKTMADSTKDEVAESIILAYALEKHMPDYGVEITADELAAMEEAAKQFMKDNSKKAIRQLGATEEYVKEMLRMYTIQTKMENAVYEASEATVTDEEAAQRIFSYFRAAVSDAEDDTTKADMEQAAKDAQDDFEAAAEAGEYNVATYSYGSDEANMDEAVIDVADSLKEGEVSELITTDNYYYVIRLDSEFDEEATEERRAELLEEKKAKEYNDLCAAYMAETDYEINEEEWAKVKFDRLFGEVAEDTEE